MALHSPAAEREEGRSSSLTYPLIQICEEDGLKSKVKNRDTAGILEEVKKQLWLAGPLVSVNLLNLCLQVISVMFVGHLGELPLSGASMATSFATVTGFSLLMGMASALDTLCGQSHGLEHHRMQGIHMQRAMVVLMVVSIPLAVVWVNTKPILIALGQDHEISAVAGGYARLMVPSLFAYGLLQCLQRFMQAQNTVYPMMFISAATTLLHVLTCYVMVFKSGLGTGGAAVANSVSYWVNALMLSLYVKHSKSCSRTWTGFSKEALHGIPTFVQLAIPSAFMVCLEAWSFELMVLLSGLLPDPELETSVLSICLNTAAIVWMIPYGLSGAISVRVSNEVGAGHPTAARLAVRVVLVLVVIEGIAVGAGLILVRRVWGRAYSDVSQVVRYVAAMVPILAASNFLDGLQATLSGVVRGCGRQKNGAFINLGSYYLVGIPLSLVFAFVLHLRGRGLWSGTLCALFVQGLLLFIITIRTDWDEEVKKARERAAEANLG